MNTVTLEDFSKNPEQQLEDNKFPKLEDERFFIKQDFSYEEILLFLKKYFSSFASDVVVKENFMPGCFLAWKGKFPIASITATAVGKNKKITLNYFVAFMP